MMRGVRALLTGVLLLLLALSSSCGFQLRGSVAQLDPSIQRMAIESSIDRRLLKSVRQGVEQIGGKIVKKEGYLSLTTLSLQQFRQQRSDLGRGQQYSGEFYRLSSSLTFAMYGAAGEILIAEKRLRIEEDITLAEQNPLSSEIVLSERERVQRRTLVQSLVNILSRYKPAEKEADH